MHSYTGAGTTNIGTNQSINQSINQWRLLALLERPYTTGQTNLDGFGRYLDKTCAIAPAKLFCEVGQAIKVDWLALDLPSINE